MHACTHTHTHTHTHTWKQSRGGHTSRAWHLAGKSEAIDQGEKRAKIQEGGKRERRGRRQWRGGVGSRTTCIHTGTDMHLRHTHIHIRMHIHTHTDVHAHAHVCMYVCMYVRMYVCMYVCMHACMHVYMYVCMYVCKHARMYVCMHTWQAKEAQRVYTYTYTYTYTHTYTCILRTRLLCTCEGARTWKSEG